MSVTQQVGRAGRGRGGQNGGMSAAGGISPDDDRVSTDPAAASDIYDGSLARGASVGFCTFSTALGDCGIAWGPAGITAVELPAESVEDVLAALGRAQPGAEQAEPPGEVRAAIERIRALLAGGSTDDLADIELDMSGLSELLERIYAITRTITPGHTLTYGQIAERLGNPGLARAVGRAMGANPFPIIVPCHRVLGADGSIGGFSAHGGALTKRHMLINEGVAERDEPGLFEAVELYGPATVPGRGADSV